MILGPVRLLQAGGGAYHKLSGTHGKAVPFQRFILVLTGSVEISSDAAKITLTANHFAFFPANAEYQVTGASGGAGLLVYERAVEGYQLPQQEILHGEVDTMPLLGTGTSLHLVSNKSNKYSQPMQPVN